MKTLSETGPEGFPVPAGAPVGFVPPFPVGRVWRWLNDPATFTEGQVWPFRVEFVDGGFESKVLNVHHGPFLNVAGVIGEVRGPRPGLAAYRDLKYFYGSYAMSPRLVRPNRLQFWAEVTGRQGGGTLVTLQLDSLVRRPFVSLWERSQKIFWARFPMCMKRELSA
jgi:hypothetical protein